MAGAQCVPPTAVGPAPTQPQLVKEERAAGSGLGRRNPGTSRMYLVGEGMLRGWASEARAWRVGRELRLETECHREVKVVGRAGSEEGPGALTL